MVTGALPPSVAQGQSFVNDPSMTNASEVKAHIKLRFNNKSGQPTVVVRLYQVSNLQNYTDLFVCLRVTR